MVARELVPELVVMSSADGERFLPHAADGAVEVYAGNDGFEAYGYFAGGHYWAHLPGTASFRFLSDDSSVVAFSDSGVPPGLVEDVYLRNVLPLVLQLRGYEALHASAVSTPSGLVAFCGVSGAGKTTFASALSARGNPVWADDAVVLDVDTEEVVALQVPFRLGLRRDATASFATEPGDGTPSDAAPARPPVAALLNLGRSDEPELVRIARLEPTEALIALLPHAYYFWLSDPARKALMVDRYMRVASVVPTFDVLYRPDLDHIAAVLDVIERHIFRGIS